MAKELNILARFFRPSSPDDLLIFTGLVSVILGMLSCNIGTTDRKNPADTDLGKRILLHLERNYQEAFSLEGLARHFGYNREYLSRFFNSHLGCGFNRYMNALRSRHAAQMIMGGNGTLTEISADSGFDNYRTFNRAFLSVYGVTPSEFRKGLINRHEVRRVYQVPEETTKSDRKATDPPGMEYKNIYY